MVIPILYEDTTLVAIDKPSGIVVNRAESVKERTIQDWVEEHYAPYTITTCEKTQQAATQQNEFINRSGIVHRLDKETSGVLLIAKNPEIFFKLQQLFKEHKIKKTYITFVHGKLTPSEGTIKAPVDRLPWNREHFGIVPGGKDATTEYKVRKYISLFIKSKPEDYSVVEVYPQSGRTHQIRVHMKYIGHPVVGDYLYAGRKTSRADRKWATRVMLHAWKVQFIHPILHKELVIESPIPDDLKSIIG